MKPGYIPKVQRTLTVEKMNALLGNFIDKNKTIINGYHENSSTFQYDERTSSKAHLAGCKTSREFDSFTGSNIWTAGNKATSSYCCG